MVKVKEYLATEQIKRETALLLGLEFKQNMPQAYITKTVKEALRTNALYHKAIDSISTWNDNLEFNEQWLETPSNIKKLRKYKITETNIATMISAGIDDDLKLDKLILQDFDFTDEQIKRYLQMVQDQCSIDEEKFGPNSIPFELYDQTDEKSESKPRVTFNENLPTTKVKYEEINEEARSDDKFIELNKDQIIEKFDGKRETILAYLERYKKLINNCYKISEDRAIRILKTRVTEDILNIIIDLQERYPKITIQHVINEVRKDIVGEPELIAAKSFMFYQKYQIGMDPQAYCKAMENAYTTVMPYADDINIAYWVLQSLPKDVISYAVHEQDIDSTKRVAGALQRYISKINNNQPIANKFQQQIYQPNYQQQGFQQFQQSLQSMIPQQSIVQQQPIYPQQNYLSPNYPIQFNSNQNYPMQPNSTPQQNYRPNYQPRNYQQNYQQRPYQNNQNRPNLRGNFNQRRGNNRGPRNNYQRATNSTVNNSNQNNSVNANNLNSSNNSNTSTNPSSGNQASTSSAENCNICFDPTHSSNNCPRNSNSHQLYYRINSSAEQSKKDVLPEVKIKVEDTSIEVQALFDTGAGVSVIRTDIAEKLGLRIYHVPQKFIGFAEDAQQARGVTQAKFKVNEPITETQLKIYVFDKLPYEMILGANFAYWSNTGALIINHERWSVLHYNKGRYTGFNVSMIVPSKLYFDEIFANHFLKIYGPEVAEQAEVKKHKNTKKRNKNKQKNENNDDSATNPIFAVNNLQIPELYEINYAKQIDKRRIDQRREEFPSEISNLLTTLNNGIDPSLTDLQRIKLNNFFNHYIQVFSKSKYDIGKIPADVVNIKIDLGMNPIPQLNPYRLGPEKREILDNIIKELIENDIVEPSTSRGGSPAFLVAKSTPGTYRLVTSFQELNSLMRTRNYPMPNIEDFIQALAGYNYFITIDFAQGFHQIELAPEEREKVAFVTETGKFQYIRLPMGLADSPAYFQQFVNKIFGKLLYKSCLAYIDDVIIFGKTFDDLLMNAAKTFNIIKEIGLKIQPDKCKWGHKEVKFLGHIISGKSVKPDPAKVERLKNFKPPKDVKSLQSQLGLFNYLAKFIPNYSTLASNLFELCSKKKKFRWTEIHQQNWLQIKKSLVENCELCQFDRLKEHQLEVDASSIAVGGMLTQKEDDAWRPVAYFGQKLAKHQFAYTITEKECLAVIVGVLKYGHYLSGKRFNIISDHCALCSLKKINFKCTRLHRWATILSQFDYKIIYRKGSEHPADCFSRSNEWRHKRTGEINEEDFYRYIHHLNTVELNLIMENSASTNDNQTQQIDLENYKCDIETLYESENQEFMISTIKELINDLKEQSAQPEIINNNVIKNIIFSATHPEISKQQSIFHEEQEKDLTIKRIKNEISNKIEHKNYIIKNDLLCRKMKNGKLAVYVPQSLIEKIYVEYHEKTLGGHFGFKPTIKRIRENFWFPLMNNIIRDKIRLCDICGRYKHKTKNDHVPRLMPIPRLPLERIQIDVVGAFKSSKLKNKYLFVAVDMLTHFVFAQAYKNQTSKEAIDFIEYIIRIVGPLKEIQTDNGPCFRSDEIKNYMNENNFKHIKSTPYRPESQGLVERTNGIIGNLIKMSTDGNIKDWDKQLTKNIISYNHTPSESLGNSPHFLLFQTPSRTTLTNEIDLPEEFDRTQIESIRQDVIDQRILNQEKFIQKQKFKDKPFKPGDVVRVAIKNISLTLGKKLTPAFKGKYIVYNSLDSVAEIICSETFKKFRVNFDQLKLINQGENETIENIELPSDQE